MASVINDSVWEDSGRWIRRSLRNVAARILEHLQPRCCFAGEVDVAGANLVAGEALLKVAVVRL